MKFGKPYTYKGISIHALREEGDDSRGRSR